MRPFHRRPPIRAIFLLTAAAAVTLLSGCLIRETQVEHFMLVDGGPHGTYSIEMRNVESDGATPYHQQQDFDTMIRVKQSDEYLLDRVRSGIYVQGRTLSIENGVLVGREHGLFLHPVDVGLEVSKDGTLRRKLGVGFEVLESNGRVESDEDTISVVWPPGSSDMKVRARDTSFKPATSLVAKYRQWAKTK